MIVVDLDYFCDTLRKCETPQQRREFIEVFGGYDIVEAAPQREEAEATESAESS